MKKLIIILNLVAGIFTTTWILAEVAHREIIDDILKTMRNINTCQLEFVIEQKIMDKEIKMDGKMVFKKPTKFKMETNILPKANKKK